MIYMSPAVDERLNELAALAKRSRSEIVGILVMNVRTMKDLTPRLPEGYRPHDPVTLMMAEEAKLLAEEKEKEAVGE